MDGVSLAAVLALSDRVDALRRHMVAAKLFLLVSCSFQTVARIIPVLDLLYNFNFGLAVV